MKFLLEREDVREATSPKLILISRKTPNEIHGKRRMAVKKYLFFADISKILNYTSDGSSVK